MQNRARGIDEGNIGGRSPVGDLAPHLCAREPCHRRVTALDDGLGSKRRLCECGSYRKRKQGKLQVAAGERRKAKGLQAAHRNACENSKHKIRKGSASDCLFPMEQGKPNSDQY